MTTPRYQHIQINGETVALSYADTGLTTPDGFPIVDAPAASGGGPSSAVTIADGADTAQGATTDAGVLTDTNATLMARIRAYVVAWAARIPTLGQKTSAGSTPVVIANDQSAIVVTSTDGGQATIGTTSDASSANTLVGLLKAIKAAVVGTLNVTASNTSFIATQSTGTNLHTVVDSGSISVSGTPNVAVTSLVAIPTGANTIGNVGVVAGSASIGTVGLNAGTNAIGSVTQNNPVTSLTATIANGTSLSPSVQIPAGNTICGILFPGTWAAASVTFQISADNSTFGEVNNSLGTYSVPSGSIAANVFYNDSDLLTAFKGAGGYYVKVRSGTSGTPVNQSGGTNVILRVTPV